MNSVVQIKEYKDSLTELKGVGSAKRPPIIDSNSKARNDFGELYPPILEKHMPPNITPMNGAVKQVNAKK